MEQFDVFKLQHGEIVIILQHDTFDGFKTRMAAPLRAVSKRVLTTTLNPMLRFGRKDWILATHVMSAVPVSRLAEHLGTLRAEEYKIKRAIDQLFLGI